MKLAGLVIVGLLLWKLVFNPPAPRNFSSQSNLPARPEPASGSIPQKPPAPRISPAAASAHQEMSALVQGLKSSDLLERRRAAAALNNMHSEAASAAPALREALKDSDSEVRMWAALSLISNQIYDRATGPVLIEMLHHKDPAMRKIACLSLALIPYAKTEKDPVISALTECASNDGNEEVRDAAASSLKMTAPESARSGR